MIDHVLRRRIVRTEQQLIPESLRHWDFATPISAATPIMLQQGHATTQVFTMPGFSHMSMFYIPYYAPALMRDLSDRDNLQQGPAKQISTTLQGMPAPVSLGLAGLGNMSMFHVPGLYDECHAPALMRGHADKAHNLIDCTGFPKPPRKRKMRTKSERSSKRQSTPTKPGKSSVFDCPATSESCRKRKMQDFFDAETESLSQAESMGTSTMKPTKSLKEPLAQSMAKWRESPSCCENVGELVRAEMHSECTETPELFSAFSTYVRRLPQPEPKT